MVQRCMGEHHAEPLHRQDRSAAEQVRGAVDGFSVALLVTPTPGSFVAQSWMRADPELQPVVAEARAALGRLTGEPRR